MRSFHQFRTLVAVAAFIAQPAFAQDHLEPEDSVFAGRPFQDDILLGYDRDLTRKFAEIYNGRFAARVIVLPAFDPEYSIAISSDAESPVVVGLRAEAQLYSYWWMKAQAGTSNKNTKDAVAALRESLPDSIEGVAMRRCETPISQEDRALYLTLWREMLFRTRFSERHRFRLDGVTYHFSGEFGFSWLAGKVWRPEEGSMTGRFATVAENLYAACKAQDESKLAKARQEAKSICAELGCRGK